MYIEFRGSPEGGPQVDVDHTRFRYAGKFNMTTTGKALLIKDETWIAIASFNRDRTCEDRVWLRYITVRDDHQQAGIGPRFLRSITKELREHASSVRIAVNNPYAYQAAYKSGFVFTGEQTGIAEVILEYPEIWTLHAYEAGLTEFTNREGLSEQEREFVSEKRHGPPPPVILHRIPVHSPPVPSEE